MRLPRRSLLTTRLRVRRAFVRLLGRTRDERPPPPWRPRARPPHQRLDPRLPAPRGRRAALTYPAHLRHVRLRHRDKVRTIGLDLHERCWTSPGARRPARPAPARRVERHGRVQPMPREHELDPVRLFALALRTARSDQGRTPRPTPHLESAEEFVARMRRRDRQRRRRLRATWCGAALAVALGGVAVWLSLG